VETSEKKQLSALSAVERTKRAIQETENTHAEAVAKLGRQDADLIERKRLLQEAEKQAEEATRKATLLFAPAPPPPPKPDTLDIADSATPDVILTTLQNLARSQNELSPDFARIVFAADAVKLPRRSSNPILIKYWDFNSNGPPSFGGEIETTFESIQLSSSSKTVVLRTRRKAATSASNLKPNLASPAVAMGGALSSSANLPSSSSSSSDASSSDASSLVGALQFDSVRFVKASSLSASALEQVVTASSFGKASSSPFATSCTLQLAVRPELFTPVEQVRTALDAALLDNEYDPYLNSQTFKYKGRARLAAYMDYLCRGRNIATGTLVDDGGNGDVQTASAFSSSFAFAAANVTTAPAFAASAATAATGAAAMTTLSFPASSLAKLTSSNRSESKGATMALSPASASTVAAVPSRKTDVFVSSAELITKDDSLFSNLEREELRISLSLTNLGKLPGTTKFIEVFAHRNGQYERVKKTIGSSTASWSAFVLSTKDVSADATNIAESLSVAQQDTPSGFSCQGMHAKHKGSVLLFRAWSWEDELVFLGEVHVTLAALRNMEHVALPLSAVATLGAEPRLQVHVAKLMPAKLTLVQ
jgi:hypothetical protein